MRRKTNRQQAEIERKYYPGLKLQLFQDFTAGYRLNQSLLNNPGLFLTDVNSLTTETMKASIF